MWDNLIIIVVVVGRNEQVVLLQEVGHIPADGSSDQQSRDDGQYNTDQPERNDAGHRFQRSAAVSVLSTNLPNTQLAGLCSGQVESVYDANHIG